MSVLGVILRVKYLPNQSTSDMNVSIKTEYIYKSVKIKLMVPLWVNAPNDAG